MFLDCLLSARHIPASEIGDSLGETGKHTPRHKEGITACAERCQGSKKDEEEELEPLYMGWLGCSEQVISELRSEG